jgi:hypothetical protein
MPERTVTCGDCGDSRTFPDGDYELVQRPVIIAWKQQHEHRVHGERQVSGWDLDPNPMFDRD